MESDASVLTAVEPVAGADMISASTVIAIGDGDVLSTDHGIIHGISANALAVKRLMDIVFASLLVIFLLPILAIIAVAIKLDSPGPVLFKQRRFIRDPFFVCKLRTMYVDACDTQKADRNEPRIYKQAQKDDARITRCGRLLRRTSLDELPQLINVLRGEMSLVGPRPHPIALDEKCHGLMGAEYAYRHRVKPGLTGWAQVNGFRGETETIDKMQRRCEFDKWYIDNWSLLLDVRILFLTVIVFFRPHHTAY